MISVRSAQHDGPELQLEGRHRLALGRRHLTVPRRIVLMISANGTVHMISSNCASTLGELYTYAEIICTHPTRSYVQSAAIICAMRRDHMHNSPSSYVKYAEPICTICQDHMHNTPRSYAQYAEIIRPARTCMAPPGHMHNAPRSYIQFAEVICIYNTPRSTYT